MCYHSVMLLTGYGQQTLSDAELDRIFSALADPTRRAILTRLASGEAGVLEVASQFTMTHPAVTKHLKVLEKAGLISRSKEAQRRPCRLEPARIKQVSDWMVSYRDFLEDSFARLDDYLETLQQRETEQ